MRKGLYIGIDYYENFNFLEGCCIDAIEMARVLSSNYDGSPNFDSRILTSKNENTCITKKVVSQNVIELFKDPIEIALFYFSGHGYKDEFGGYLIGSDSGSKDGDLSMEWLMNVVNKSPAYNKVIILDCCHSGEAGNFAFMGALSLLKEGVTVLAASMANESAIQLQGRGVFTTLFITALNGSAANFKGEITLAKIYSHIDESLGAWEQRPVFKTHSTGFISLRRVAPKVSVEVLHELTKYFPNPDSLFPLDPSYEDTNHPEYEFKVVKPYSKKENVLVYKQLLKYYSLGLIAPSRNQFMYFAAMQSDTCFLTDLGKHYWYLINNNKI
jgi:hypothetical protein